MAYYDDNFGDTESKIIIIQEQAKAENEKEKLKRDCWRESLRSTPEGIILYSTCDGSVKKQILKNKY